MDSGNRSVIGVVTRKGEHFKCREVVLCTGTFLNGVCHIGRWNVPAGRFFVVVVSMFHYSAIHWTLILLQFTWLNFFTR